MASAEILPSMLSVKTDYSRLICWSVHSIEEVKTFISDHDLAKHDFILLRNILYTWNITYKCIWENMLSNLWKNNSFKVGW